MKLRSLLCLATLSPVLALANIIPSGTTITGLGPYVWTYNLQLAADQNAVPGAAPSSNPVSNDNISIGSFLTIYDFDGYVLNSCTSPLGWTCTAQNVGYTPDNVIPDDDAGISNLTWTYTSGPTINGQPSGVDLGNFSATSIYNTITQVSYAGRAVKNQGSQAGSFGSNVGETQGPTSATAVPEPGSLALAGLGLMALAMVRRQRTKAQTA